MLTVTPTAEQATDLAAARIAVAIGAGSGAHMSLAGGHTPIATYERLAASVTDWTGVELWMGDERMVPPDDPENTARMVRETLIDRIEGTPPILQQVRTEFEPEAAASEYAQRLRARVAGEPPALTVALLGIGPDGHTASLFPHAEALGESERLCVAIHGSPKPPPERVTFTLPVFAAARQTIVLVVGSGKATALAAALGDPDPATPASLLARERLEWIVDEAAAADVPADRRS